MKWFGAITTGYGVLAGLSAGTGKAWIAEAPLLLFIVFAALLIADRVLWQQAGAVLDAASAAAWRAVWAVQGLPAWLRTKLAWRWSDRRILAGVNSTGAWRRVGQHRKARTR